MNRAGSLLLVLRHQAYDSVDRLLDSQRPLHVVIDARLTENEAGGIAQFVLGLASGLKRSRPPADMRFSFLVTPGRGEWIKSSLPSGAGLVETNAATYSPGKQVHRASSFAPWLRVARWLIQPLLDRALPRSDGTVERIGADLVHFTNQDGFRTSVPSLYHPWDLQHIHYPEFFTPSQLRRRRSRYRKLARQASIVIAPSTFVLDECRAHLAVSPDKSLCVSTPPVLAEYESLSQEEVRSIVTRMGLPPRFALYPAQTWPHKNHAALLQAIAILGRDPGLGVKLVCTGSQNSFFPQVRERVSALNLDGSVYFTGHLHVRDLLAAYQSAQVLVFPSLFEGLGMPVLEAFWVGLPVAASRLPPIEETGGDAVAYFDPLRPEDIARVLRQVWVDEELKNSLALRGRRRVKGLRWSAIAPRYVDLYRRVASRPGR